MIKGSSIFFTKKCKQRKSSSLKNNAMDKIMKRLNHSFHSQMYERKKDCAGLSFVRISFFNYLSVTKSEK